MGYYDDKKELLDQIFGCDTKLGHQRLHAGSKEYEIIDDVIHINTDISKESRDIQQSFGEEWSSFNFIEGQHDEEFDRYFDLVNLEELNGGDLCDLGCGMGRWSKILLRRCSPRYLVCVDFSDAIYAARKNLFEHQNVIYIKADILKLPFATNSFHFMFSLGVLHHTTTNALDATRTLARLGKKFLVYLYYNLDNRSLQFRLLFQAANIARNALCKIKNNRARMLVAYVIAVSIYKPFIYLGTVLNFFGLGKQVPLYEFYQKKSVKRISQDAYDRFFTSIEQRFNREEILKLNDTYSQISVSENIPYWHFLCKK